ncbi:hypothetical protein GPX89_36290 [Nocardia sp. ET3-3]|uniref:Exo-alpha-sialidase n=1 Tax=Nocardia terrae TaxID=2675851 RepID=A0A7K1V7Q0_9NOCA|nr:hypothetical protein [Nocardia terrae]MVU82680.1 hypothetical protein [Nocardia terrae]
MGLRNPVALAGVVGVGVPVLAAGLVAALTLDPGGNGLDPHTGSHTSTQSAPPAPPVPPTPPTPGKIVAEPDPVGFQPDSINFVSADEGWVLGRMYPCTAEPCQQLRHTTDGGRTWQQVALPAPLQPGATAIRGGNPAGALHFADTRNGWAWIDHRLFSTHDGGKNWREVELELDAEWAISFSEDSVWIAGVPSGKDPEVWTSPLDSESWTRTTDIPNNVGGGPKPLAAVSAVGNRAWLVVYNRTQSGSRLVEGTWTTWQLPCGGNGPAGLHAFTERRLVALCGRLGPADDGGATRLMTSTDGGATFTETGQLAPTLTARTALIPADPAHLVAAIDDHLLTSADGGATWTTTYTAPDRNWNDFSGEFVTETTGFVILSRPGAKHYATMMLTTEDAGRTWTPVSFG